MTRLPEAGPPAAVRSVLRVSARTPVQGQRQHLGRQLGEHGIIALPGIGGRGVDGHPVVGLQFHCADGLVTRKTDAEGRGAQADTTFERFPGRSLARIGHGTFVLRRDGLAQAFESPLAHHMSGGLGLPGLKGIQFSQGQRVHVQLLGQHVHGALQGVVGLGRSGTAGRAAPWVVGVDQSRGDLDVGNIVGTCEHVQGAVDDYIADGVVGAVVHGHVHLKGGDFAVGIGAQADLHLEGVALGGDQHRLGQAGDIAHGPPELEGRRRSNSFGEDLQLDAELAAGKGLLVADVLKSQGRPGAWPCADGY